MTTRLMDADGSLDQGLGLSIGMDFTPLMADRFGMTVPPGWHVVYTGRWLVPMPEALFAVWQAAQRTLTPLLGGRFLHALAAAERLSIPRQLAALLVDKELPPYVPAMPRTLADWLNCQVVVGWPIHAVKGRGVYLQNLQLWAPPASQNPAPEFLPETVWAQGPSLAVVEACLADAGSPPAAARRALEGWVPQVLAAHPAVHLLMAPRPYLQGE
jgi:hypothetical protein